MEFILCYTNKEGEDIWESVFGEDAMNIRVCELEEELGCESEDIMVFERNPERQKVKAGLRLPLYNSIRLSKSQAKRKK